MLTAGRSRSSGLARLALGQNPGGVAHCEGSHVQSYAEAAGSFRLRLTSVSGFPRSWLNIRWPCSPRRLRPLQTVHADFPHTACPDSLTPWQAPVARLGRGARSQLSQEVLFRSRVAPSGPPSLLQGQDPVGALRSTGVTRLPRYYDPLRLLPRPEGGYGFPHSVAAEHSRVAAAGTGLPGS